MSERERFEAAYAAIPTITPTKETAWLVWQAARSGQAAARSSQGARSDERVQRLQAAIEGECDGLAVDEHHAKAILDYVLGAQPEAPTAAPLESAAHPAYWPEFPPFPTWIDANDLATLHEWAQTVRRDAFAAGLQRAAIAAHPPARSGAGSEEGGQG